MKSILITGCCGFIGVNLSLKFLKEGHKVIGIDNNLTSNPDNLDKLIIYHNFKFIQRDITADMLPYIDPYFKMKVDEIYHLASPASPPLYKKYWEKTIEANTVGTDVMLKLATEKKAKIFLASTSEVYGDPIQHPQKEEHYGNVNSFGERSLYDESKRMMEAYAYQYIKDFDTNVRIGRIFNTYGPYMYLNDGRVVINFFKQALSNKDITVYGNGFQTRSLMYIDDLLDAFELLMESDYKKPINLGNPEEISVIEIAKEIKELCDSSSKITFHSIDKDDPKERCPDISLAKRILGWEPKISRKEGFLKMKKWIEKEVIPKDFTYLTDLETHF